MRVSVQDIKRNDDATASSSGVVYDILTSVDGRDRVFKVLVTAEKIGPLTVPCANFCDDDYWDVFKYNQNVIPQICKLVNDAHVKGSATLPVAV